MHSLNVHPSGMSYESCLSASRPLNQIQGHPSMASINLPSRAPNLISSTVATKYFSGSTPSHPSALGAGGIMLA